MKGTIAVEAAGAVYGGGSLDLEAAAARAAAALASLASLIALRRNASPVVPRGRPTRGRVNCGLCMLHASYTYMLRASLHAIAKSRCSNKHNKHKHVISKSQALPVEAQIASNK